MTTIGEWKVFKKAGLAPWKSLIPIYNIYCHIVDIARMHWIYFVVIIIIPIFSRFAIRFLYLFYGMFSYGLYRYIFKISYVVTSLAIMTINIIMCSKTSKNFGKGIGFTIGLIFLFPVFILILGFGNAIFNPVEANFITPKSLPKFEDFDKESSDKKEDYFDV
jgi:hypothetical protein